MFALSRPTRACANQHFRWLWTGCRILKGFQAFQEIQEHYGTLLFAVFCTCPSSDWIQSAPQVLWGVERRSYVQKSAGHAHFFGQSLEGNGFFSWADINEIIYLDVSTVVLQCAVVKAMVSTSLGALRPDIAWVRIVDCKPPDKVTGRAGCRLFSARLCSGNFFSF